MSFELFDLLLYLLGAFVVELLLVGSELLVELGSTKLTPIRQ